MIYWVAYEYGIEGEVRKETEWDNYTKNECTYNAEGKELSWTVYSSNGTQIQNKEEYEYDENGNKIKETKCGEGGAIEYWITYEYDENNECIYEIKYNADGSVLSRVEYEYQYVE